mmetsp:Transcript_19310/g.32461  ORF Transcript_19310/g.32461 Transcript_19310/m.32461 type:complete len:310 (-) Transcript_19310:1133-2062(-)
MCGGRDRGGGEGHVSGGELLEGVEAHAMAEVAQGLSRGAAGLVQGEDGLQSLLEVVELHLVHVGLRHARLVRAGSEPDLIGVGPVAHKPQLCHVRARAAVRAPGHARDETGVVESQLVHDGPQALHHGRHPPLRLPDGQPAQRHGRAGHAVGHDGVKLGHVLDTRRPQSGLDVLLPGRIDLRQDDVLVGGEADGQLVALDDGAQARAQGALQASVQDGDAVSQKAITLLNPAMVGDVLPGREGLGSFELLPVVLLRDGAELVDPPAVHQVLQARLLAVIAAPVVALRRHNRLHRVEDVLLRHITEIDRE